MTEEAAEKEPGSSGRTLLLLAVFAFTFLLVLAGAFLVKRPDLRQRLVEQLRYGTGSASGLVLQLEVAPTGSLSLVFMNVGVEPRELVIPIKERAGPEVDVIAMDSRGQVLEQHGPVASGEGAKVLLAPGESWAQELRIAEFVDLPPGRSTVHVERAKLRAEEPRLRSNTILVDR